MSEQKCESNMIQQEQNNHLEDDNNLNSTSPISAESRLSSSSSSSSSSSPPSVDAQNMQPDELYRKLEIIKEIKSKTSNLQRIKTKLMQEIQIFDAETKCLDTYKSELDLLFQEKLAQVEELKQINADINDLELTIKQADDEKRRALEAASRLKNEYKPLKDSILFLRDSIGLDKIQDIENDGIINEFIPDESLNQNKNDKKAKSYTESAPSSSYHNNPINKINPSPDHPISSHLLNDNNTSAFTEQPSASSFTAFHNGHRNLNKANEIQAVQLATAALVAQQMHKTNFLTTTTTNDPRQTFRQQPPPMKACLSCNQQIHRNAPICPLCKAKSRSRNPKKPKKKQNDEQT